MVFSLWIFDTAALLEAVAAGHAGEVAELVRPGARNAQWIQSLSAIVNGAAFSAKLLYSWRPAVRHYSLRNYAS